MSDEPREILPLPKPIDTTTALMEALTILAPLQIRPVLIGGVAMGVYGVERYTKDIDLALKEAEVARVSPLLQEREPRPLRIGGLSFLTTSGVRVDLIDRRVDYRSLFEAAIKEALERGPVTQAGGQDVAVVTVPYLIALKLIADRPQDEADLNKLLSRRGLDYTAAREVVYRYAGAFAAQKLDKLARLVGRQDTPKEYSEEDS